MQPPSEAIVIGPMVPDDDAGVRRLLREAPMQGAFRISLEREPDVTLAAAIEGDRHVTLVARRGDTGRIVGIGSRAVRDVWLNGAPARLGYLGQLRVEPGHLGRRRLVAGFEALERTRRPDELPFDLTSIIADNTTARRLFERGLPGLPHYRRLCEYVTLLIAPHRLRGGLPGDVRPASAEDLPAIVDCLQRNLRRYQLAPLWTEAHLRSSTRTRDLHPEDFQVVASGTRVVGCIARWDQRAFKQAIVRGYAPALARFRPVLNVGLALVGRPTLPRPGTTLGLVYLSHLAVDDDCEDVAMALIDAARHHAATSEADTLVAGFGEGHPLLPAVQRRYPAHTYRAVLYLVHPPSMEAELIALDGRVIHLEVATF